MTTPDHKDRLAILSLSVGHFINDAYSNFLGPLLPFLVPKLNLSIAEAGWLAAILVISSSFTQPLYGYISDRYLKRAFVVFSPLVTALFMSCLGLANSYAMLALLLVCGGVGIASFHPQGAAMTALASRNRKGLGMSIFVTSGTIGYSLGPILITYTVLWFGLERSYFVMIPGLIVFAMLFFLVPSTDHSSKVAVKQGLRQSLSAVWQPLSQLYVLVVIRSAVQMCFVNFLPLYLSQKGLPPLMAGKVTTLFLFFGALGGFSGGTLADKFGGKNVISFSMLFSTPLIMSFLLTDGVSSYLLLALRRRGSPVHSSGQCGDGPEPDAAQRQRRLRSHDGCRLGCRGYVRSSDWPYRRCRRTGPGSDGGGSSAAPRVCHRRVPAPGESRGSGCCPNYFRLGHLPPTRFSVRFEAAPSPVCGERVANVKAG